MNLSEVAMQFYRIIQHKALHSFGDPIGLVPICGKKLQDHQNDIVQRVSGSITEVGSAEEIPNTAAYFVFEEDFFFTEAFLRACIKLAHSSDSNLQFCLEKNSFNERYVLPTKWDEDELHVLNFKYVQGEGDFQRVVLEQEIFEHSSILPEQIIIGGRYHMDQCEVFAAHIISPFHLLLANLAMNLHRTIPFQKRIPKFLRQRFGQTGGRWYYRALKRMNKIGKQCMIHPSAHIEGSVLGDNVVVGANAVVRGCTVSNGCYISDNVSVINSVLGEKTFISNSNHIMNCLTYPSVFLIHGPYQISVFGESSSCFAVINCDIRLDQKTIKIPTDHGILDSNQEFLGIAYGHRSKTGGGNIIAAGRIVPNDLHIKPPDSIILNFKDL